MLFQRLGWNEQPVTFFALKNIWHGYFIQVVLLVVMFRQSETKPGSFQAYEALVFWPRLAKPHTPYHLMVGKFLIQTPAALSRNKYFLPFLRSLMLLSMHTALVVSQSIQSFEFLGALCTEILPLVWMGSLMSLKSLTTTQNLRAYIALRLFPMHRINMFNPSVLTGKCFLTYIAFIGITVTLRRFYFCSFSKPSRHYQNVHLPKMNDENTWRTIDPIFRIYDKIVDVGATVTHICKKLHIKLHCIHLYHYVSRTLNHIMYELDCQLDPIIWKAIRIIFVLDTSNNKVKVVGSC